MPCISRAGELKKQPKRQCERWLGIVINAPASVVGNRSFVLVCNLISTKKPYKKTHNAKIGLLVKPIPVAWSCFVPHLPLIISLSAPQASCSKPISPFFHNFLCLFRLHFYSQTSISSTYITTFLLPQICTRCPNHPQTPGFLQIAEIHVYLNHPQLPPLPYGLPLHLTPSMNSSPCVSSFSPTDRASVSLHVLLPLLVVAPLTGGWI